MKRYALVSVVLVIAVLAGLAVGVWAKGEKPAKTLAIGIAGPLTGPVGNVATNYKNAVLMAIDDQNAKGGVTIAGVTYKLKPVIRDTKFDPAVAKTVAEELVYNAKVKVIMGPSQVEGPSMLPVTEPNKVILFGMSPVPEMCGPNHPYNFFAGGIPEEMYATVVTYVKKFYPDVKTVLTFYADLPDAPPWMGAGKEMLTKYGFTYLGSEQAPFTTTDFAPAVQRIMSHHPDMVDLCGSGGAWGGVCGTIVKQLRQGGFKGVILMPTVPPPGIMTTVPKEYLNKIVTNDINIDSPIVTKTYRDLVMRYEKQYGAKPIDFLGQAYNGVSAFFAFLDGQKTMDATAWMEGFANYHWTGVFGEKARWVGKPIYGIDRALITNFWASEWKDGKLETNFVAPLPMDMFAGK